VGQCHVSRAGEGTVSIQSRSRTLQRVVVLFSDAVGALTRDRVRSIDGVTARQEQLDQLVVVVVACTAAVLVVVVVDVDVVVVRIVVVVVDAVVVVKSWISSWLL